MSNVSNRQWPHAQSPAGWPTTTNAAQPTTQPWPIVRMPTVPPAAAEILRDAVFHIDAAEHQCSGANPKTVRNLGWGGAVLNARSGSTTVANTNDPSFLPYNGTPYVYLPGIAGNSLTCTAPATATQYLATALDGTTASGAATGGATFTFSTAGSWATVSLLDAGSTVLASFVGANLTTGSATAQTDTYAVAWTINRASSGRKSVAVVAPVWLFGTDDYMSVRPNKGFQMSASDAFTALFVCRQWPAAGGGYFSNATTVGSNAPGWIMWTNGNIVFTVCDEYGNYSSMSRPGMVSGECQVFTAGRDPSKRLRFAAVNGSVSLTAETISLALEQFRSLTIGSYSITNGNANIEVMSAALFRRTLSASEIATLIAYYTGKYR